MISCRRIWFPAKITMVYKYNAQEKILPKPRILPLTQKKRVKFSCHNIQECDQPRSQALPSTRGKSLGTRLECDYILNVVKSTT
jgi:hypothetical protein